MESNFTKILEQWLPITGTWTACWRATRDGWAASTFHSNCDGKIPTLVIVKVAKNSKNLIFGGYCTVTWAGSKFKFMTILHLLYVHCYTSFSSIVISSYRLKC